MADFLAQIPTILWGFIALYRLSVAIFILLENRSPHLTLTWLFVFILIPYSPLTHVHTISYRNHRKLVIIDDNLPIERSGL